MEGSRTPAYVRHLNRFTKHFPNFDFSFIKPVREYAVSQLELKSGDRVVDAGCGSGGSFPYLRHAVGAGGEVLGIEISPESTRSARKRIERNSWDNVSVQESAAENAALEGVYDGLLMFAAPDVFGSEDSLRNLLPKLKMGARVVAFGAKMTRRPMGFILNPMLLRMFKLSFPTTPKPEYEAARVLAGHLDDFKVREYFFGSMFVVSGVLANHSVGRAET